MFLGAVRHLLFLVRQNMKFSYILRPLKSHYNCLTGSPNVMTYP